MATEDLERRVGRRVRDLREIRVWTQEELAARMTEAGSVRVYQSTVAKIEKGGRPLRVNELDVLAAVFETSLASLVDQSTQSPREVALEIVERRNAELQAAMNRLESAEAARQKAAQAVEVAKFKAQSAEETLGLLIEEQAGKVMGEISDYWSESKGDLGRGEPREEA